MILFRLLPNGFRRADLRTPFGRTQWSPAEILGPGAMTYRLRGLRLHGMIQGPPNTQYYHVTDSGFRAALFFTRAYNRLLRPGLGAAVPAINPGFDDPLTQH